MHIKWLCKAFHPALQEFLLEMWMQVSELSHCLCCGRGTVGDAGVASEGSFQA